MLLKTYKKRIEKKRSREFLFSFFTEKELVGLAGPDINETVDWYANKGFNKIHIYENDKNTILKQIKKYNLKIPITHTFGDIIESKIDNKNVVFDLDFTKSIMTMDAHVKKFKNSKFVMTFALRPISFNATVRKFFLIRKEKILSKKLNEADVNYMGSKKIPYFEIKTNNGKYIILKYKDKKALNMICLAKIK